MLSDLDHPNILHCTDGGDVVTTHSVQVPFIVTDLFLGNLEFQITTHGPLSPTDVKRYALCLCDALQYIHGQGVIHRDIKPSNIFLSAEHGVVLGDFGIANTATDAGADRYYRTDVTLWSEFVGPVLWLSPELAAYSRNKDHPVDHRSDLFQLGLVIWYLLAHEIPRGVVDEADDPTGGQFYSAVQMLLKQKPERRYQSAAEARAVIAAIQT